MTSQNDFDRTLAGWFEADAQHAVPAHRLAHVLDTTRQLAPRRGWLARPGSRWVGEAPRSGAARGIRTFRTVGSTVLVVALLLAALVGGALVVGGPLRQQSPVPVVTLGKLVYALDGDIYLADWDARNPVRIADGSPDPLPSCAHYWGEGPMWSPDGRYLAYRSAWDLCPNEIRVSDQDGREVVAFPGWGWRVAWSPDSTRIATWVDPWETIGVYGLDGDRQALLQAPDGMAPGDYDPVWSPDGQSLIVAHGLRVPIDGGESAPFPAGDPRSRVRAGFSPDGTLVAYIGRTGGGLMVATADGSGERLLVPGAIGSYAWSAEADRIAFTTDTSVPRELGIASDLGVVDVASRERTTLVEGDGSAWFQVVGFSPDGERILYSRTESSGGDSHHGLWTIRADGSDHRLLVDGTASGHWQWLRSDP
jgi:Tol biopolymer transport system component